MLFGRSHTHSPLVRCSSAADSENRTRPGDRAVWINLPLSQDRRSLLISRVTITAVVAWMSVVLFRHFYSETVLRKEDLEDLHVYMSHTSLPPEKLFKITLA